MQLVVSKRNDKQKAERPTNGLASVGVYARGKFCGNLKICRPSELLRSPARTPSRQPLGASNKDALDNKTETAPKEKPKNRK